MSSNPPPHLEASPRAGLRALTYPVGDVAVIAMDGWLDGSSAAALDKAVTSALERGHRNLVLDMHGVRRLEPNSVGVLWAGLRAATRRGGTLSAAGLRPSLLAAVDPLVPHGLRLHDTVRSAVSASQRWNDA